MVIPFWFALATPATTTVTPPTATLTLTPFAPGIAAPALAVDTRPADSLVFPSRRAVDPNPAKRGDRQVKVPTQVGHTGEILVHDGIRWRRTGTGAEGQVLTVSGGTPRWLDVRDVWTLTMSRVDTGSGVTALDFMLNGLSSQFVGVPIPFDVTFHTISVNAMHIDSSSPPSTGTIRIRKNGGFGADVATFTFNWNAASSTEEITYGELSAPVSLSLGDRVHVIADFAAVDIPAAYFTLLGART